MNKFRTLEAEEIEVRVSSVSEKVCTLLLYKDARTDANILDETVGPENWQNEFVEIKGNLFCGVAIRNERTGDYTVKWDCGTESNTEAQKGEASDAFKRACFKWGIGRELYTAPNIKLFAPNFELKMKNGRPVCYDRFRVSHIAYKAGRISELKIENADTGATVYELKPKGKKKTQEKPTKAHETDSKPPKEEKADSKPKLDYSRFVRALEEWARGEVMELEEAKKTANAVFFDNPPNDRTQEEIDRATKKLRDAISKQPPDFSHGAYLNGGDI